MNDYYKWDWDWDNDNPFDFGYDRDLFSNISTRIRDQLTPKRQTTLYDILNGRVKVNLDTIVISQGKLYGN